MGADFCHKGRVLTRVESEVKGFTQSGISKLESRAVQTKGRLTVDKLAFRKLEILLFEPQEISDHQR